MKLFQKLSLSLILLCSFFYSDAQQLDTVRVMTYNLMYYREFTSFCTASNNSTATKENAMEDIFDHTLPDLFVVNELGGGASVNAFRLLQNSINKNGRSNYTLANSSGVGQQSLVNMLYYNTDKFVLESQSFIDRDINNGNLVRGIDIYHLRYKDSNLAVHLDTVHLHIISAHLKAGSASANETERALATEAVMAHLDSMNATGNYLFSGDLNLYSSTEPAYRDLVNYVDPTLRFFDPINVSGNWHNNATRAFTHTQSTRTSGGCFAGGGMDDRFDFILASDEIMNNTDKMRYITGTYEALGQDGNRFNQTIISPTNNSVPNLVSQALFNLSDHLPVLLDLEITIPSSTRLSENKSAIEKLKFPNPISGNLLIDLSNQTSKIINIQILNGIGQVVFEKDLISEHYVQFQTKSLPRGTYYIKVINQSYQQSVEKLIKI